MHEGECSTTSERHRNKHLVTANKSGHGEGYRAKHMASMSNESKHEELLWLKIKITHRENGLSVGTCDTCQPGWLRQLQQNATPPSAARNTSMILLKRSLGRAWLPLRPAGAQLDPTGELVRQTLALVDAHIVASDRSRIAQITGYAFSTLIQAISRSTTGELTRFFSSRKFAEHHANRQGMHLLRCLLAERMLEARRRALFPDDTLDDDLRTFSRDGILLKDFGSTTPSSPEAVKTLMRILEYATGDREVLEGSFRWARINFTHSATDLQRVMHSDTFASCIKVWSFPERVTMQNGPFHFVNGSHMHTDRKLRLLHRLVLEDEYIACESPRLYTAYANEFGFNSEPVLPKKGTIVIVDTNGFHHRGYATPGTDRSWYTTSWRHMGITWGPLGVPRRNPFEYVTHINHRHYRHGRSSGASGQSHA
jgi:hypothetical protein